MVPVRRLDAVLDQARLGQSECRRREAPLCVEETGCALAGCTIPGKAARVAPSDVTTPGLTLRRLELSLKRGGQLWQRDALPRVKHLGQGLVAELRRIHHVLHAALEVEVRPVRLNHLHQQVVVLAVDVQEKLLLLEGLGLVVRCRGAPSFVVCVRI